MVRKKRRIDRPAKPCTSWHQSPQWSFFAWLRGGAALSLSSLELLYVAKRCSFSGRLPSKTFFVPIGPIARGSSLLRVLEWLMEDAAGRARAHCIAHSSSLPTGLDWWFGG